MIFSKLVLFSIIIYSVILILIIILKPKIFKFKNSKNPVNRALIVYLVIISAMVAYYFSLFNHVFKLY
uniref:Uncharacterized protein n=1 Tax=viral metagenome TaxID=1070528 RepID=A0A6C0J9Z2_9ZZZZ